MNKKRKKKVIRPISVAARLTERATLDRRKMIESCCAVR